MEQDVTADIHLAHVADYHECNVRDVRYALDLLVDRRDESQLSKQCCDLLVADDVWPASWMPLRYRNFPDLFDGLFPSIAQQGEDVVEIVGQGNVGKGRLEHSWSGS
jgi:hypothetical protein